MATNLLGLFFLIIGASGIKDFFYRSKISSHPVWPADTFDANNFKGRSEILCRYKYGPFACRNILDDRPYFRIETSDNRKNYPKWQYPYFRHGFPQDGSFEEPYYKIVYDPHESSEESTSEHDDAIERNVNKEQKHLIDYIQTSTASAPSSPSGNPIQLNVYSKLNAPATSSDGVTFKKLSNVKFLTESNKDRRITETSSNTDISQIMYGTRVERQQKSSPFMKNENVDLIEGKHTTPTLENLTEGDTMESSMSNKDKESASELPTNISGKNEGTDSLFTDKGGNRIDGLIFLTTSYLTTTETKGISPKKTSSLQEHLKEPKEENLLTESRLIQNITEIYSVINRETTALADKSDSSRGIETRKKDNSETPSNFGRRSTIFPDPLSFTTRESTSLNRKANSPNSIQPLSHKESKLEPTASQTPSSTVIDDGNSLKTKSSPSEGIHSVNTQNLNTESYSSLSSFIMTHDGTASQSKLNSPDETQSTTAEILETESTTENSITSNEVTSIPLTDKVTEDSRKETFSTETPSSKIHFTPEVIKQDHIIEISSIRTARIVVTSIFLVIALIALTVLAVYIFRLRRREVEYDQLMLIR